MRQGNEVEGVKHALRRRIMLLFISLLYLLEGIPGELSAENPHRNLTLPCESCHISVSWDKVRFNHRKTKFSLEDRHREVDCKSCHDIGDFSQVSAQCFTCHEDVHQAKMGGDCEKCHTFQGWEIFNVEEIHANTKFPLMGRHTAVDCQSCHQNQLQGDFALLTTDCVACHQQEYLAAENPNHVANSFSTDCQDCHDMNSFQPALLPNHDVFFPIFSGQHSGAWNACMDCHQNPATFADFTCLTCHEHEQAKMDEKHQGIAGYVYESTACLSCHPTGEKGGFADHDKLFFPIFTGTHAGSWNECLVCHTNPANRQQFSCLGCHEHRQEEMDPKHAGIPGYSFDSNQCLFCHPAGERGSFTEHDNLFFPIFSGTHNGSWNECLVCHTNPANRQEFSCLGCHEHRQEEMDPKHAGIPGYSFDSNQCLFCHPAGERGNFTEHDNLFFPIFSGAHKPERWNTCDTCHFDPNNRQIFTCLNCHAHNQPKMDEKHRGETGYIYESTACYDCHPNGRS